MYRPNLTRALVLTERYSFVLLFWTLQMIDWWLSLLFVGKYISFLLIINKIHTLTVGKMFSFQPCRWILIVCIRHMYQISILPWHNEWVRIYCFLILSFYKGFHQMHCAVDCNSAIIEEEIVLINVRWHDKERREKNIG